MNHPASTKICEQKHMRRETRHKICAISAYTTQQIRSKSCKIKVRKKKLDCNFKLYLFTFSQFAAWNMFIINITFRSMYVFGCRFFLHWIEAHGQSSMPVWNEFRQLLVCSVRKIFLLATGEVSRYAFQIDWNQQMFNYWDGFCDFIFSESNLSVLAGWAI